MCKLKDKVGCRRFHSFEQQSSYEYTLIHLWNGLKFRKLKYRRTHTHAHTPTHTHAHTHLIPVEKLFDVKFVFALVSSISVYTVYKEY